MPERLPAHVQVRRANAGRSTLLSVRLSAHEHERLQRAAAAANLPASTLMRLCTRDRLHAELDGADASVTERLARLEREVFSRSA